MESSACAAINPRFVELEAIYDERIMERLRSQISPEAEAHDVDAALRGVLMDESEDQRNLLLAVSEWPCASRAPGLNFESVDASRYKSKLFRILKSDDELRAAGGLEDHGK